MTESIPPLEPKKYDISIEYCVPCDYSAEVLQAAEDLLSHYQHIIGQLVLITGTKGVLDVKVGNEILFSKKSAQSTSKTRRNTPIVQSARWPQGIYLHSIRTLID